jgi:hypothetical protein
MIYQKTYHHFVKNFLTCSLLWVLAFMVRDVSAYQFTYTSQELTKFSHSVNGGDGVDGYVPPPATFSVIFDAFDNGLTYDFLSADVIADSGILIQFTAIPGNGSSISLNDDGSIAAWNFSVEFMQAAQGTNMEYPPDRALWRVESSYGIDSCNCESLMLDFDVYTQRQN